MSDQPVRTRVMAGGRWWPLQEYMIRAGGRGAIQDVEFRGADDGAPDAGGSEPRSRRPSAIVIGPSNPVISIGPILAVPGIREALNRAAAPVVAVSPLVAGAVLKGPTEAFMRGPACR